MSFLTRIFGDLNAREVNRYQKFVQAVNDQEPVLEKKTDVQLTKRAKELRQEIGARAQSLQAESQSIEDVKERQKHLHKTLNELLAGYQPEVFASVREAAKRAIGLRHFDVQLIGGAVLNEGKIAEMQTGEGKTLVATLPVALNALTGLGVHLVTVNDYLARRDAGWMAPVYSMLGLSTAVIGPQFSYLYDPDFTNNEDDPRLQHLRPITRREAYQADITYGTNNEFGFDYLRDNMTQSIAGLTQRPLYFAIVDEVDSILVDEARTPLIISNFSAQSANLYRQFADITPKLKEGPDYSTDEKMRSVSLSEEGIKKLEQSLGVVNLYDPGNVGLVHHADTALKAQALYKKNRDYVVKDGEIVIIDEFTGRMLTGRRYSSGLHQALEAKEKVNVQEESVTLATITFQNYFRIYTKVSGMTGTATTEAEEFSKIYGLEVVSIPTHRASQRKDLGDVVYKTEAAKFNAIVTRVKELQEVGQPVLIGTVSIAKSEKLARILKAKGVNHAVLNAKQHQKEGEVVAQAGRVGAVTVATNMAGRGVDIVLGGAAPGPGASKEDVKKWEKEHQKVIELGGLYVVGTERHESRRIDNQLRGRSGRQGDPGASQFYISMEDDLMRIFGGDRMKSLMERLNIPDDMSINNSILNQTIEQAQSRVEGHNFDIRKQLVEYDDVTNKQREAIYRRRRTILEATPEKSESFHQDIVNLLPEEQRQSYDQKTTTINPEVRFQIEQAVYLRAIDTLWIEHLKNLEDLRESIGLRGYGQRDPIVEYKQEAYKLYRSLEEAIVSQVTTMLTHMEIQVSQPAIMPTALPPQQLNYSGPEEAEASAPTSSAMDKVGRNDPCPCGAIDPKTGKVYKYKKCGLINAPYHKG